MYPCTRMYSVHRPVKTCVGYLCFYRCFRHYLQLSCGFLHFKLRKTILVNCSRSSFENSVEPRSLKFNWQYFVIPLISYHVYTLDLCVSVKKNLILHKRRSFFIQVELKTLKISIALLKQHKHCSRNPRIQNWHACSWMLINLYVNWAAKRMWAFVFIVCCSSVWVPWLTGLVCPVGVEHFWIWWTERSSALRGNVPQKS